jgi:hypothetical protein
MRHRIRRAAIPAGVIAREIRLQDSHPAFAAVEIPGPARADVIVQRGGRVLGEHADRLDARVAAVAEDEVDDAVLAAERHRADRALGRQHAEPLAPSAGENQRHQVPHRRLSEVAQHREAATGRPVGQEPGN